MNNLIRGFQELINSGDPEVRTWFLVRHNYLPFIFCTCYVLFCKVLGPAIMKKRKPFELRMPMIIFNFYVVATYVVGLAIIFWNLRYITKEQFCIGDNVRRGDVTFTIVRAGWVLYILKYIEFLDTVFFVLRKKNNQITALHVIHHTVVPLLGWISLRTEKSGMQSIPALVNSFVHVIMYSYYGLAAIGPQVQKYLWWKKYLTQLQIVQFVFIILFVSIIAPMTGCTMVMTGYLMDFIFGPLFLYLFYKFYKAAFKPSKETSMGNNATLNSDESWSNGNAKAISLNGNAKELCTNGNVIQRYTSGNSKEMLTNGNAREMITNGNAKEMLTNGNANKELQRERNERPKGE